MNTAQSLSTGTDQAHDFTKLVYPVCSDYSIRINSRATRSAPKHQRMKTGRPIEMRGHGDQPPLAFRAPAQAPPLAQTRLSTEIVSFRFRSACILPLTTVLNVFRK